MGAGDPCVVLVRKAFPFDGIEASPAFQLRNGHSGVTLDSDLVFFQCFQPVLSGGLDFQRVGAASLFWVIRDDRGLHPGRQVVGGKGQAWNHGLHP